MLDNFLYALCSTLFLGCSFIDLPALVCSTVVCVCVCVRVCVSVLCGVQVQARDREVSRLTQNQVADISQGEKIENLELQLLELKDEMSSVNTKLRKSQDEAAEWKNTCEANESTVNRFKAECDRIRGLLVLKTEELQSAKDQAAEVEREQRRLLQEVRYPRYLLVCCRRSVVLKRNPWT